MWILTVVLMLASGQYQVLQFPEPSKYECLNDAQQVFEMNDIGFNVIASSCARIKDT